MTNRSTSSWTSKIAAWPCRDYCSWPSPPTWQTCRGHQAREPSAWPSKGTQSTLKGQHAWYLKLHQTYAKVWITHWNGAGPKDLLRIRGIRKVTPWAKQGGRIGRVFVSIGKSLAGKASREGTWGGRCRRLGNMGRRMERHWPESSFGPWTRQRQACHLA
jgi:hypothetical protein